MKNFVFHSNLSIKEKVVKKFPKVYQETLTSWEKYLSSSTKVLSTVVSQFIWCNEYIEIDNNAIYYCFLITLFISVIFFKIMIRSEVGKI